MNEISALYSFINSFGQEEAISVYQDTGIKKYSERFNSETYDRSHETDETRELIALLDEQATRLRNLFDDKTITKDEFDKIYKEMKTVLPR